MYDLIVIGAGPGGYEAAGYAGRMGKKVALIEKQWIGGTCLNVGCIPTKAFLKSAQVFSECRNAAAYGVEVSPPQIRMPAVIERKNRIVGTLTRGVEGMLKRSGVEVIRGCAKLAGRGAVQVGSETYAARNILIATGSRPAVPPIPGIDSAAVLDSTSVLDLAEVPGKLAIIGGGYIGLEFAGFFAALGTEVTVIEMLPRIAAGMDADIANRLAQALKKSGVEIKTGCAVQSIDGNTVHYEGGSVCADYILNATGRAPVLEDLGLEAAGVDFDRKGIKASDRGATNVPGIWACGDVTGRRLLAHAATREGIVAVNNMFGKPDRLRYDSIPSVIYTHPEVASVGATEDELKQRGIEYRKATVPMGVSGRFLVENEGGSGLLKILAGAQYGEILGVHALGDLSSEFIVAAAALIELEMRASDAAGIVFPHPTVSEALKQALDELAQQES
ncbi:MAG: dihydrolipoyl dehydrogenase [Rhodospirillales bacterium]